MGDQDTRARRHAPGRIGLLVGLVMIGALLSGVSTTSNAAAARSGQGAVFVTPIENYAGYQPPTKCIRKPRAGIRLLAQHLESRGGAYGGISRACPEKATSEHHESRAFDWTLDARSKRDRVLAKTFLREIFAPDAEGNADALARRMGIMYIIWNDKIWSSYRGFKRADYVSSSCVKKTKKKTMKHLHKCSVTLRHRDHMHISLTRKAARGQLSWYQAQQGN
ncbi:hypothetical protein [Nocardioides gilvus]|uniref:hypothetical protein n=1 Tax=Nocardioides gilvus TaxID=1735589 RepID=UPI0013A578A0|nr:hypothetical protein [Nocardioides gilvus]